MQGNETCPTCQRSASLTWPKQVYLANEAHITRRMEEIEMGGSCANCSSGDQAEAYCCDCELIICASCAANHKDYRVFKSHKVMDSSAIESAEAYTALRSHTVERRKIFCGDHHDEVLKYFCESCNVLVCHDCIIFSHLGHKYKLLSSAVETQKVDLHESLPPAEQKLSRLAETDQALQMTMSRINARSSEVKSIIEQAFDKLVFALEKRKETLIEEVGVLTGRKVDQLQQQRDILNKFYSTLKFSVDAANQAMSVFSPTEFLYVKMTLKQCLSRLAEEYTTLPFKPASNDSVQAEVNPEHIVAALSVFGSVWEGSACHPRMCSIVGVNPKLPIGAAIGAKRTLIVQTRNAKGEDLDEGGLGVEAWLIDRSGTKLCSAEVSYTEKGKYSVTFQTSAVGACKLHITIGSTHINHSPYNINMRDYSKITQPVLAIKTPLKPSYLYVDGESGNISVTFDNGSVGVYSSSGSLKSSIVATALNIKRAMGLAVDKRQGVMYLSNGGSKIIKATLDGRAISSVGTHGSGELQFNMAMGLCLDDQANLYIADYHNCRLQVFDSQLSFKASVKCRTSNVQGVAIDADGNVHTATSSGLAAYSKEGLWLDSYGGEEAYADIAITPQGFKFASIHDNTSGSISIFAPNNDTLHLLDGFNYPLGVFMDQSGYLYLAEFGENRVLKY